MATILIVDDKPLAVETLSTFLRLNGHTPLEAYSVSEALD